MKKFLFAISGIVLLAMTSIIPVTAAEPETKLIALTFDDGPNTTTTNEILDLLEEYQAKASFFLIGEQINENSAEVVKRAYAMGCEIDNHSKTHSYMSKMTAEEMTAEINYVNDYVYAITGDSVQFFRPPYIDVSETMYETIDLPFICGVGCGDSDSATTAEQRAQEMLTQAKDGQIFLLHDFTGNEKTVEALNIALPKLKAEGYEFVTLSELFSRQGETPQHGRLYSNVTKYPCTEYSLYQEISSEDTERIILDSAVLATLGDNYAIEVDYSGNEHPPVIALQKWTDNAGIWKPVQPCYDNGSKACFLAEDVLSALQELHMSYNELDRVCISPPWDSITLSNAKLLTKPLAGDVNADDAFTLSDLILLQKWLLSGSTPLPRWQSADMDNNQILNIFDFVILKQKLFSPL